MCVGCMSSNARINDDIYVQEFYVAPMRVGAGRTPKWRPLGKRKEVWEPELEGSDSEVEELRQRGRRRTRSRAVGVACT